MFGTQQICKFKSLHDMAKKTKSMGSKIIKCKYHDDGIDDVFADPFFKYYFIWFRSHGQNFTSGFVNTEHEYWETYQYATNLFKLYNGTGKEFYLGNWEGDWYLLPDKNKTIDAVDDRCNGMVEWINIRYKAVCDAKRDHGAQSDVKVYYYVELNRLVDSMEGGYKRLVDTVLPRVTVDLVSVSSYDIQERSVEDIEKALSYIEQFANFSKIENNWSRRIFIGEFGIPAIRFDYDDQKHCEANVEVFKKYQEVRCPFILYWAMYNNEFKPDGRPKGLWLINDREEETELYNWLKKLPQ